MSEVRLYAFLRDVLQEDEVVDAGLVHLGLHLVGVWLAKARRDEEEDLEESGCAADCLVIAFRGNELHSALESIAGGGGASELVSHKGPSL